MENIKFLGAANEVQKIYNDLGLLVPVGDLSQGKAPGFKVYEVKYNEDGEDSAVNATIQIYCNSEGSGIYALYKTSDIEELFPNGVPTDYDLDAAINDPMSQDPIKSKTYYAYDSIPFRKDMYTLSMPTTDGVNPQAALPYDDYTLIMSIYTCPLECMTTTVTSQFSVVAPPNWATPDEVLEGNKYIGEDGQEHTGEYVAPQPLIANVEFQNNAEYDPADSGLDGFGIVTVNVPASAVVSGTLPITQNGEGIDVTNYAAVDVAVPAPQPVISNIEFLNNDVYNPADYDLDGFGTVTVNVQTNIAAGHITGDFTAGEGYTISGLVTMPDSFVPVDVYTIDTYVDGFDELSNWQFVWTPCGLFSTTDSKCYMFEATTNDIPSSPAFYVTGRSTLCLVDADWDYLNPDPEHERYIEVLWRAETIDNIVLSNASLTDLGNNEFQFEADINAGGAQFDATGWNFTVKLLSTDNVTGDVYELATVSMQADQNNPYHIVGTFTNTSGYTAQSGEYAVTSAVDPNSGEETGPYNWGDYTLVVNP